MKLFNSTFLLRLPVAVILLVHSLPGMFDNGINDFGNLYLNTVGFSPLGVPVAWAIILSHVACAIWLLIQKFITPACLVTIFILIMGIIMVYFKEGWFVVGGLRNGAAFNFLMLFVLLAIMFF